MTCLDKKTRIFSVICRLNVKYWHLPYGSTDLWEEADKVLLERAVKAYNDLSTESLQNSGD